MTTHTDVRSLRLVVKARLDAITHLHVLEHALGDVPADVHGRAYPYAVIYPGAGGYTIPDERLDGSRDLLAWRFQVTCAAGDLGGAEWAMQKVRAALTGTHLTTSSGLVREDFTPDTATIDTDVPGEPRWYYPLVFAVNIP